MTAHEMLAQWEAYYVIVGTSAGALTGLQFVVMALVAESQLSTGEHEISTFGTPTVFHFVATLLVSAALSAPWPTFIGPSIGMMILGLVGVVYAFIVARRAKRAKMYQPVLEDWVWHVVLPLVTYVLLVISGALLPRSGSPALFVLAGCALLLLGIGIHNAWDTVIYVAMRMKRDGASEQPSEAPPSPSPPQAPEA